MANRPFIFQNRSLQRSSTQKILFLCNNSGTVNVYSYNLLSNVREELTMPSIPSSALDLAHTETKLWVVQDYNTIYEWNITLTPFLATYYRSFNLSFNTDLFDSLNTGLFAINNTLLVGSIKLKDTNISEFIQINLSGTPYISYSGFRTTIYGDCDIHDLIVTSTNKILFTIEGTNQRKLVQRSFSTFKSESEVNLNSNTPTSVFEFETNLFIGDTSGNIYGVSKTYPYSNTLSESINKTYLKGSSMLFTDANYNLTTYENLPIIINGNDIYSFNPINLSTQLLFSFSFFGNNLNIIHTHKKLWVFDNDDNKLYEWNITFNPFNNTLSNSYNTTFLSPVACIINDNQMLVFDYNDNIIKLLEFNSGYGSFNTTNYLSLTDVDEGYLHILYTQNNKLIVCYTTYYYITIMQYDFVYGSLTYGEKELEFNVSYPFSSVKGIFEYNDQIYIIGQDSQSVLYRISNSSPYTLNYVGQFETNLNSISQVVTSNNLSFQ